MMCKRISAFLIGALLTAGCAKKAVMSVDRAEATYANVSGLAGPSSAMCSFVGLVSDNSHRFIAVRHKLENSLFGEQPFQILGIGAAFLHKYSMRGDRL